MSILTHHGTQANMLQTPASFASLNTHREHPHPHTFIFRGDELLVRESDLALPDLSVCAALAIDNAGSHPVGMLDGRYCRTVWVDATTSPPAGFTFRKLRALFGALGDE